MPPTQTSKAATFELDTAYRRKLNEYGRRQYEAIQDGAQDRADRYRSQLVDSRAVGSGVGRNVYPLPDRGYAGGEYDAYVLKLPSPDEHVSYGRRRDGRVQNRAERDYWVNNPSGWLVPVVAADPRGHWLVMPEGTPLTEFPDERAKRVKEWFGQHATLDELDRKLPDIDLLPENLVILDGYPRLCDYGLVED